MCDTDDDDGPEVTETTDWVVPPPRKWSWFEFVAVGAGAVCGVLQVLANGAGALTGQLREHDAYRRNSVGLAESVMSDIKQL